MLRSNTAHLQSEDKSAEPPQEQRPRLRVLKREVREDFSFFCTQSWGRSVGGGVVELSLVGDYCYRNLLSLMDDG